MKPPEDVQIEALFAKARRILDDPGVPDQWTAAEVRLFIAALILNIGRKLEA